MPARPGSEKNVPPRLTIVPDIGAYFADKPNWLEVTPRYLMNWTDFRQARITWCGLAIVAPELSTEYLYEQSMFTEAWKWWTYEQSQPQRHVGLIIKDEYSGKEFSFGAYRPHITGKINIFTKEFFDLHRNPSKTVSRVTAWETILTTMLPGAEVRNIDAEGTIEHWLDAGSVVLPTAKRNRNPRHYEQTLVLRHGNPMTKASLYRFDMRDGAVTTS